MRILSYAAIVALFAAGAVPVSAQVHRMIMERQMHPVQVNRCEPQRNRTTTTSGWFPGYYPGGRPYYWTDIYGRQFYQYPYPARTTTSESPTLSIDYVNRTNETMKEIEFGLVARGSLVAEVRDVGTFSPGAEIKHRFGISPNVFPLGTALSRCVPLRISFENGSSWRNPRLPALNASIYRRP